MPDDYPDSEQGPQATDPRARLIFAGILAAVLVAVVVAVVVIQASSGPDEPDIVPAPTACVDSWNDSRRTLLLGQHNYSAHNYKDVEVTYLTRQAEPADADSGLCAVIFGRATLDPEPGASGQVQMPNGAWLPISVRLGVEERELQRLQVEALRAANADLQEDGTLEAADA